MKKSLIALLLLPAALIAQGLKPIALPEPQTTGGKPLMQALKERQSTRTFSTEKLSPQQMSNLLWAAWGINRPNGNHTAPSASNRQEIDVYAVTADGAYVYDPKGNALKPIAPGDLRKLTGSQAFVADAALNLVYVADYTKLGTGDETNKVAMSHANTGFMAQNVYLFCASEGLGVVVRAMVPRDDLSKALNLRPEQKITLAQTIGYIRK